MQVHVDRVTLEPGDHQLRKTIAREQVFVVELPDAECKEERPDWGEYSPVVTFPAIERALRSRGYLGFGGLSHNERWSFGIIPN
jgi:hypothetical protein